MADFKRVVLLKEIKPSVFLLDDERELEVVFVRSDFNQLIEDVFSTKERTLYEEGDLIKKKKNMDFEIKMIENYKFDPYDIVYIADNGELYKVYIF